MGLILDVFRDAWVGDGEQHFNLTGYYTPLPFGGEIRPPERNIPRGIVSFDHRQSRCSTWLIAK